MRSYLRIAAATAGSTHPEYIAAKLAEGGETKIGIYGDEK
jgi:hypothetical protein